MNGPQDESAGRWADQGVGQPPPDLPTVPRLFWSAHPDFQELSADTWTSVGTVLETLGPPPFPKAGFPFIGYLATIYDHVSAHAGQRSGR